MTETKRWFSNHSFLIIPDQFSIEFLKKEAFSKRLINDDFDQGLFAL